MNVEQEKKRARRAILMGFKPVSTARRKGVAAAKRKRRTRRAKR